MGQSGQKTLPKSFVQQLLYEGHFFLYLYENQELPTYQETFPGSMICKYSPFLDGSNLLYQSPDRESIASQCMDINRNPRISEWISIKAWIIKD